MPSAFPVAMNLRRSLALCGALIVLSPAIARAQLTNTASAAVPEALPVVALSPFEVSEDKDQGYAATHSLAGGRINTELINTPTDVTVLTKEFLNDIGALDYIDAAPYMTGVVQVPASTTDHGHTYTSLRGMPAGVQTRNYFQSRRPVDGYILERLEGLRGPNSLIFGDGALGGGLNTTTKRARPARNFAEAILRGDSEGSLYGSVDVNRALGADGAVRANLFGQQARFWQDRKFDNRSAVHLAALHRPWAQGELRFETEYGKSSTLYAPASFSDGNSNYTTGYRVTAPLAVASPAPGVNRITTETLVWSPTQSSRVQNLINFGRTTGTNLAITPDLQQSIANFPTVRHNLSIQPRNATADIRHYMLAGYFEHQWGRDLAIQVAVQYANIARNAKNTTWSNMVIDPNAILPDGSPNPKAGQPYDEKPWVWYLQDSEHLDLLAALAYQVPTTRWKQRVSLFLFRREEIMDYEVFRTGRSNNPANPLINATVNVPLFRIYYDDPQIRITMPSSDGGYQWETLRTTDQRTLFTTNSAQLATVASFWAERLNIVAGLRADDYEQRQRNGAGVDAAGRYVTHAWQGTAARPVTSSAGFVLFPVWQVGVYGNYAESFNPVSGGTGSGGNGLQGQEFGPTQSHSYSGGLRFRLIGDRVVGSLGYYRMTEANRVVQYSSAGINRIWNNLNKGELQVDPASNNYRDTLDYFGSGVELDLTANLGRNFRLRGNFAKPKTQQTNTVPGLRTYYARHNAEWRVGAADPTNPNRGQIVTDLASIETTLSNAFEGRALNQTPDYTGSIFAMYTLAATRLKGLRFGGGVAWQGPRIIGNQVNRPYDYVKSDGYYQANLSIGYALKLRDRPIDLQFNITNLLDHADPIYRGTNTFRGETVRTGFYYLDSRKASLAATHRF